MIGPAFAELVSFFFNRTYSADTTATEIAICESIFRLRDKQASNIVGEIRTSLIDEL